MAMRIAKIVHGFVIQEFDTETQKYVAQSFIAGNEVEYEDPISGEPAECFDERGPYLPFDMVQPFD